MAGPQSGLWTILPRGWLERPGIEFKHATSRQGSRVLTLSLEQVRIGIIELDYGGLPLATQYGKRFDTVGFAIDDAIVLAVAHRQFVTLDEAGSRLFGMSGAVLYDIKYVLPKDAVDGRL